MLGLWEMFPYGFFFFVNGEAEKRSRTKSLCKKRLGTCFGKLYGEGFREERDSNIVISS